MRTSLAPKLKPTPSKLVVVDALLSTPATLEKKINLPHTATLSKNDHLFLYRLLIPDTPYVAEVERN